VTLIIKSGTQTKKATDDPKRHNGKVILMVEVPFSLSSFWFTRLLESFFGVTVDREFSHRATAGGTRVTSDHWDIGGA
jgi:hypothetical protein